MLRILPLLLLMPAVAQAQCQTEVFACSFNGGAKAVQVCVSGADLTYRFGASPAAPELALAQPLDDGTFQPWPGVGSAIWESVAFRNGGYAYEVWSSQERDPNAPPEAGGVNVTNNGKAVAELVCDRGSVRSDFRGLSDAMYAQGLCWDRAEQVWRTGTCE